MSRSRDALQRVGTSAPIYAALAERLSSMEGASHPGDGFSRRRGPGSAPRPATAAVRPPVAGPGLATSCSASSSSGSASRSHARAAALAAERAARAAVRERKELQQRQHFEDEQPLALQLRALQLRAFIAARQAAVRGSGGGGGAGSNGTGGGLSGSIGVAAEEALEKVLEKERRVAANVKAAITVKVKAVKDTMEKEQKAARAVKDMEKEQKGVMTSQVSRGRSRSAGMRPSVPSSTAGSSHNGRDGGGGGGEGGGGGGGGSGGGGSGGDRVDAMLTMAHRVPSASLSASPDGSGSGLLSGPIRTESLMDRLGAKGWLPVGAPSSSCLSGTLSSSPGIRAALAAAMREPSSVAYSWRSSEADTEIHTEYTSGLLSQKPTDRFATGLGGPQPVARGAHGMGNVHAALTMRLKLPLVRRPSPPRAVGAGAPAVGTRGWFDPPDDADLLRRPEPHLLRRASLDENYERHGEGDLSREQRGAIADFMPEEQQALDAGDLFAAYDELDAIYQATPVGTQRAQLRAPRPKGSGKSISKSTKHEGGEPAQLAQLAQLAQRPGTYSPPLRALLDQLGAHPSREGEGEALDERHHRATEATIAAAIGIGKDNGSLPIRRREVGRSLGLGAPGPSHRSAASSRSRGRKAAKTGVGRKVTKLGASCSVG